MKKLMMVLAVAATTAANAAAPQTLLACWDGTFAYDTFRIEKTDERLYVSLQGSQLVERGKSFYLSNRHESLIKINDSRLRDHLVASFRLDQCRIDEVKQTAACEAGDLMQDVHAESLFLERQLDDLGQTAHLVSRFAVQRLELQASPDGLVLTKKQRFAGTGEIQSQELRVQKHTIGSEVIPLICGQQAEQMAKRVSAKLQQHLE